MDNYDIAVIGGGPAGYVAAIKGAQLGGHVVLFEKDTVGGTCLNRGCIPTKTFLKGAEIIHTIQMAGNYGIENDSSFSVDMGKAVENKNHIVKQLTSGVAALLKSNAVDICYGEAVLVDEHTIECGNKLYKAENILLCGGSKTNKIPIPGIENANVFTSDEILDITELPKRLAIIGGGVIGCEIGAAFADYGSKVTMIEAEERLLPFMDKDISAALEETFGKLGIEIHTSTKVESISAEKGCRVICNGGTTVEADKVLISIGRKPDLNCLGILKNRIQQERGFVAADEYMRTNIPNIYAAGDITGKSMLAHSAFKMGETAARNAMGGKEKCLLKTVPSCVYTLPECASVGLTEQKVKEIYGSEEIAIGKFPFRANGRSLASGTSEGFVKVIVHKQYNEILGVHIFGFSAAEMISEATSLMCAEIPADEAAEIIHAHPTFSEAFMEACADALNVSVHLPKKK